MATQNPPPPPTDPAVERARRIIRSLLMCEGFTAEEVSQRVDKARALASQHGLDESEFDFPKSRVPSAPTPEPERKRKRKPRAPKPQPPAAPEPIVYGLRWVLSRPVNFTTALAVLFLLLAIPTTIVLLAHAHAEKLERDARQRAAESRR